MKIFSVLTSVNHGSLVLVGTKHGSLGVVVTSQVHVPGRTLQESDGASLLHHWRAATKASAASRHFIGLHINFSVCSSTSNFHTWYVA